MPNDVCTPHTSKSELDLEWAQQNLLVDSPKTQFWGDAVVIGSRYVTAILDGILGDGLVLDDPSPESGIRENTHFARPMRQRLESRHRNKAPRETLAQMTDQELVDVWLRNGQQRKDHAAKRRLDKEARA
jgi:hypothetical protein